MNTPNRSTLRTKALINEAFLSLLEERGFYKIKVVDIIERANISRTTFYFYHEDKYSLVNELCREIFDGFIEVMIRIRKIGIHTIREYDVDEVSPYTQYFAHIQSNARLWKIFFSGKGTNDFHQRFSERVREHIAGTYNSQSHPTDPYLDVDVISNIGAWTTVGMISQWVLDGMKEPPEEMGRRLSIFWKRLCSW